MFGIGATELIIVLIIILIVFGVGKLPDIGGGMGKAIKNFKKSVADPSGKKNAKIEEKDKDDRPAA